ncbi:efflux transporter outer membrane subunit [Novosphingobium album (ex Liu et al. 2023)]|uniref:Efflux transporter outer membrane subunit n=1 Tax=Novosphingobium album (ex Liu et al. 2023) TaxID=3031130 RepID=A0ABT5WU82_9SPHN|nr:efflux transporter outer membrane subunit [Novosphingobium album (ex Liu et al. 2023)]MDE8653454.1 efflux transporter outer membrane subunit [Novosphingobium album (ex Liu et al. 2023)]
MRRPARFLSALLPALTLGACSLAPRTVLPEPPVPAAWPAGDAYLAQGEANLPAVSYRDVLHDARLQSLVEQALANNRDLRVAAANVAAARAQVRVTRSAQFPDLGLSGSATYSGTPSGNAGTGSRDGMAYAVQGGISSFELDLFGKLANATEAQRDRALATEAAARTVRIGLIADLAQAWATYGADRDLLAIAQATAQNAERGVSLTQARLKGGIAPRTDLRQAEQILATAQGDVAAQTAALAQDENLIRLLVGAEFDKALLPASMTEVVDSLAALPAGTRSDVLLRRPDVIEAEYGLRAANADIGVARAQLFPAISLTGLLGFTSDALSSLFSDGAFHYSAGGDASWSIFNAGGRVANVDVSKAQRDAALASYEKAIQTAFREVADALADQGTLAERLRAAGANTTAAADTARLTEARYRFGIDSYLSSLDAQRSLYAARQSEVAVRLALAANRITLYRVLGGDREAATPTP